MTDVEEARAYFSNDKFAMKTTGIQIDDVKPLYAKCSLKITDAHKNAAGAVMGGAIFTLADFTFAVAVNFRQVITLTTTSSMYFVGPTKGDTLIAECTPIKDGRRTCFCEVSVCDNLGNPVAKVVFSGTHLG